MKNQPGDPLCRPARSYLSNWSKRRQLLAESSAKLIRLIEISTILKDAQRSLVFSETVAGTEAVADVLQRLGIAAKAYHGQRSTSERAVDLAAFRQGELTVLAAAKVLDEGVDVPEADLAVIVAASKSRRQMIQRMGRILRRKADGRIARFAILYLEGTHEDPASGAHGTFLDEVTSVADQVHTFTSAASPSEIARALAPSARISVAPHVAQ